MRRARATARSCTDSASSVTPSRAAATLGSPFPTSMPVSTRMIKVPAPVWNRRVARRLHAVLTATAPNPWRSTCAAATGNRLATLLMLGHVGVAESLAIQLDRPCSNVGRSVRPRTASSCQRDWSHTVHHGDGCTTIRFSRLTGRAVTLWSDFGVHCAARSFWHAARLLLLAAYW